MIGDVVCQRSVHVGVVTRLSPCGAHFQEVYHVVFQRGEHIGQDDGRVDSSVEETVVVDGQCRRPVVASGKVDKPEILIPEFHLCEGSDCSAQIAVIGADGLVGPVLQIVPSFHEQPFEKRLQIRRFPLVDQRVEGTLATSVIGVMKGCSFVRVHDVKENKRVIQMTEAILGRR